MNKKVIYHNGTAPILKRFWSVWVMLLCMSMFGCKEKAQEPVKSIAQIQQEKGIPVRVRKVVLQTLHRVEQKGGTVEGVYQTVISASIPSSGTLASLLVKTGSSVAKGAVLAEIELDGGSPYDLAKSAYEYAENAYQRAQSLYEVGAVSKEMVEGARTKYIQAKQNLSQAQGAIQITAPFNGTVIEVMQQLNSKIGPGTPLIKVARLDQVRIELNINESLIHRFKKKQRAFVVFDSDTLWGEVTNVAIGASGNSHSFPVTTLFYNKDRRIKPGMFLTVNVITEEKSDVVALSLETIIKENAKSYVYKVRDGKAYKVAVKLGVRGDSRYEITDGLGAGDTVVVSGASLLQNESTVNVVSIDE